MPCNLLPIVLSISFSKGLLFIHLFVPIVFASQWGMSKGQSYYLRLYLPAIAILDINDLPWQVFLSLVPVAME